MAKNAAQVVKSGLKSFKKTVKELTELSVFVGVPAEKKQRKEDGPSNAMLLYIHENGAPESNIPARPTLGPGIEAVRKQISSMLAEAAKKAIDEGDAVQAEKVLHQIGIIAVSSIKKQFDDLSPPLKPSTILNRFRSRGTAKMRKSEKEFAEAIRGGASPNAAQSFFGIKPLVNTGQLRNSITYVVRKK